MVNVSSILYASTFVNTTGGPAVSRVQLALNVSDLDAAVAFYTKLFATEPAKRQPGYANFAITEPPLKLVLIENAAGRGSGVTGALNHLGVEVATPEEVQAAIGRLSEDGLALEVQASTTCCFAVQDKVWANDPDGAPWEYYTVLADASDQPDLGCGTQGCATVTADTADAADAATQIAPTACC
jgi:catechol 2,3-dioxygenase-like lactoylglutathione lyase family enzyme